MRLLLTLLLLVPLGITNAQTTYCPQESERVCFGGDNYGITLYSQVKIYFDSPNPDDITECTVVFVDNTYIVPVTILKVKEKKYCYRVVARLDHPKLEMMNKFIFLFPKY
jgi:hypothetical protein|tara:strand:+ start:493 stop:822 length:330 start_codon:yes stop_codon:yes gene_type:complete